MKCKINSDGHLQGSGSTSMMEVREIQHDRWAIMHACNDAIVYYGDGSKEEAERVLKLWTSAGVMRVNLEMIAQKFPEFRH